MLEVHLRVVHDKNGVLVAVCDAGLLGGTFREGKLKLEVNEKFYGGALSPIEEAMSALNNADVANLVGETTIRAAVQEGLVDPEAVIYFGKVPHVQVVKL
jgi:hypothetical protein